MVTYSKTATRIAEKIREKIENPNVVVMQNLNDDGTVKDFFIEIWDTELTQRLYHHMLGMQFINRVDHDDIDEKQFEQLTDVAATDIVIKYRNTIR